MANLRASSQGKINPIYLSNLINPKKLRFFFTAIPHRLKILISWVYAIKPRPTFLSDRGKRLCSLFLSFLPLRDGIKEREIFISPLLFLLLLFAVFPTYAVSAQTIPGGKVTKPLSVEYKRGLFSIHADCQSTNIPGKIGQWLVDKGDSSEISEKDGFYYQEKDIAARGIAHGSI